MAGQVDEQAVGAVADRLRDSVLQDLLALALLLRSPEGNAHDAEALERRLVEVAATLDANVGALRRAIADLHALSE